MGVSRRGFLKLTGLTAVGTLMGGMQSALASTTAGNAGSKALPGIEKKGMLVDVSKCIGCASCVTACKKHNKLPEPYENSRFTNGENWTAVKFFKNEKGQGPDIFKVKMQCMHCTEPSCVAVCPTGAAYKGADGIVLIDGDVCIGCKNCVVACPYAVPGERESSKVVEKCTFCNDRLAEGKPTACSEACPAGAIRFGDRSDLLEEANERLGQLREQGLTEATLYGDEELGGLKVIYVLPGKPLQMGLFENPQVANGDVILKWAVGLLTAGVVISGPLRKAFSEIDERADIPQNGKGVRAGD